MYSNNKCLGKIITTLSLKTISPIHLTIAKFIIVCFIWNNFIPQYAIAFKLIYLAVKETEKRNKLPLNNPYNQITQSKIII